MTEKKKQHWTDRGKRRNMWWPHNLYEEVEKYVKDFNAQTGRNASVTSIVLYWVTVGLKKAKGDDNE